MIKKQGPKISTLGLSCNEFNYIEKMETLFQSNAYYLALKRKGSNANGKNEDYWSPKKDPDGNVRILLGERENWLKNNVETISFIQNKIAQNLGTKNLPKKLIDIGTGPGWMLEKIYSIHKTNLRYFSLENSKLGISQQKPYVNNFQNFSSRLLKHKFDFIIMNHVIEHIKSPVKFFKNIINLLSSKGIIFLGTPDFYSAMAIRYREKYRMLNEPTHISLFSQDSIFRLLRDHNLKITGVTYPFFESPYFTKSNLLQILDSKKVSPPFHGNYLLVCAQKSNDF